MEMKIIQIGQPVLATVREIKAVSENGIAIAFPEPIGMGFDLNHTLSVNLEKVDAEQVATNLTTGEDFTLTIPERDMHDTHLPSGYGTSRFPVLERRRGG